MNAWWYTTNSLQLISPFFFSTIFSTRSSIFFRNFVSISHLFFFFFDEDQFYTQKFSQFREMDRYFIFQSFKTRLQSLTRTWFRGWQKLREKKKGERKIHRLSLPFENCSKFGSFRQRAEFRDAGGLVTRAFSPRSHENSRNLLDPTCVPCPWLCIVPGSPHGLTSRRREGTVCVASIRWLCCSAASPMSVPTTAKCACFFVYAPIRVYSFTVWFFPADHSFPTFLFPPFRSPLSAFSSPSFYPSSSSSSSPSKGEGTARIHHFRM